MWCFKGLLTFLGVLHTEGMKSFDTKVCFDDIWNPGDSRGWDCLPSAVSLRHITLLGPCTNLSMVWAATTVPGCLPHPGMHTVADGGRRLPELALLGGHGLSAMACVHAPCQLPPSQVFGKAAAFADDVVTWLTQLKEPCIGDRPMCVWNTKHAFAFCCMKPGTKCEIEHVFDK